MHHALENVVGAPEGSTEAVMARSVGAKNVLEDPTNTTGATLESVAQVSHINGESSAGTHDVSQFMANGVAGSTPSVLVAADGEAEENTEVAMGRKCGGNHCSGRSYYNQRCYTGKCCPGKDH